VKIYISQGSVPVQYKSNNFITNRPQNVLVKKLGKSVNIRRICGEKFATYFLCHPVFTLIGR